MRDYTISKTIRIYVIITAVFFLSVLYAPFLLAQTEADSQLLKEIMEIWAIDNHSHASPFFLDTSDYSENPLGESPFPYPVRLRVDNPEYVKAWQVLYDYSWDDMKSEHAQNVLVKKRLLMKEKGEEWPVWILDKVFIRSTFVNMPRLGPGQQTKRFRWIPFGDALVIPFFMSGDTVKLKKSVKQLMADLELSALPENLGSYTSLFVTRVLKRWKEQDAIAVKIALAYVRPLDFREVKETDAANVYSALLRNEMVSEDEYKALQDYLFFNLVLESGRIGLPVHIHTGIGADPYFNVTGSNPALLEPILNNPELRNTTFVLIHGGWPFEKEAGVLPIKPNVYIDISAQTFLRSVRSLSETLREWMLWYPEKILFGTDAYSDPKSPLAGWEEKIWLSNYSARGALAMALTQMINDGEVSRERAVELARMVLRENALSLYKLEEE